MKEYPVHYIRKNSGKNSKKIRRKMFKVNKFKFINKYIKLCIIELKEFKFNLKKNKNYTCQFY